MTDPTAPFLAACRREPVTHTPVWFMRQAGRSLPEYFDVRGNASFFDAIKEPERAAEITLQPVRRYGVDAAILFSDIVVPLWATGFGIEIVAGRGPVVERPIRTRSDLDRLRPLDATEDTGFVIDTVGILVDALPNEVALIGFAGAPFTVASYLVEGGPSRDFTKVKAMMHTEPKTWALLVDRLADMAIASLSAQVHAGADAVQLFDSWAGALSPDDYARFVLPATKKVLAAVGELGVPTILFGVGTGELLTLMSSAGPDVVGIDWRVPIDEARKRVGSTRAVQGNLDPAACLAPFDVVAQEARVVLGRAGTEPGHIFNLGHGVLPETDPGILAALVDLVHAEGRAGVRS
ncbi:MAG: uroporphyrinogen decarboxylase [Acidimicrobiales bacterium]